MHPENEVDRPRSGGTQLFLLFLAVAGGILLLIYALKQPGLRGVGRDHPGVGDRLSKLAVGPLLNTDQPLTLSDVRGKVTLVNLWGPWCPPCLEELPELLKLEKKYRTSDDVQFVLVSSWGGRGDELDELRDNSQRILSQHRADPAIYEDEDQNTMEAIVSSARLSGIGFPTTILLDRQGTIRDVWPGYDRRFVDDMRDAIAAELKR